MRLFVYPIDGGSPRPITAEGIALGSFPISPDGRHVVVQNEDLSWSLVPLLEGDPQPVPGSSPTIVRRPGARTARPFSASGAASSPGAFSGWTWNREPARSTAS